MAHYNLEPTTNNLGVAHENGDVEQEHFRFKDERRDQDDVAWYDSIELVSTSSYRSGPTIGLVEQWPDGAVHAYGGRVLNATDLDVWPTARSATASGQRTVDPT